MKVGENNLMSQNLLGETILCHLQYGMEDQSVGWDYYGIINKQHTDAFSFLSLDGLALPQTI